VYGEVVKGLEMVDFIAEVTTDKNNRPKEDIKMMVSVLSKRDIRKLEKELAKKRVK
jgi:peptidyl-prolyl cis-trans isomerase B (cyclophilin B)